jgi:hypothetical protein
MKFKNLQLFLILLFLISTWSCSVDNTTPSGIAEIGLTISPNKAKIDDTITIKGANLNKVLAIFAEEKRLGFNNFKIIKKTDTEIVAIIPDVYNEKIMIKLIDKPYPSKLQNYTVVDSLNYEIVGLFPIYSYVDFNGSDIPEIECVNQDLYYATDRKKLFITKNGGYQWEVLKSFDEILYNTFFISEKIGWVSIITDKIINSANVCELRYTNDSGKSFQTLSLPDLHGEYITDIYFSDSKKGYLLTNKGTIFQTTNNIDFTLLYKFPESHPGNFVQFSHFSVINDFILTYGRSGFTGDKPVIVTGKGTNFKFKYYDSEIWKMQQIDGGLIFSVIGNRLHISKNSGDSWEKVSDIDLVNFTFFDSKYGIGVSRELPRFDQNIVETRDGGKTWTTIRKLQDFVFTADIGFSSKSCLISGYRGASWKYVKY